MAFKKTEALMKIASMKSRLRIVQGGSSAGKTIAILILLINEAQSQKNKLISVVSESYPHLRRGAIKDFLAIMEAHGYYREELWNKTESTYTFETGSKMEFFSADQPGKVRGPRRDILFLNEANAISYDTFTQLSIRTNEHIYIDYNPVAEFFVHEKILNQPGQEYDFLIVTYKDNDSLPEAIVKEIESRKNMKSFWEVYGLGQLGTVQGRIYRDWALIDEVPHEAKLERYGLDFGYTNDPTAIVALYKYNGGFILDEIAYQKGMSNKQIADTLNNLDEKALVIADSSEPKSIDEIRIYGVNILPAKKGQGSVNQGIQFVQDQRISVTKRSLNLIKEYRNYLWEVDNEGRILNVPVGGLDHCLDAVRYALEKSQVRQRSILESKDFEVREYFRTVQGKGILVNKL